MQIEELNSFVVLFDIYGNLLSKKQFELMNEFLNFNLSESELAESSNSSRQAVHDAIKKAKKQLLDFESKCKVYEERQNLKSKLSQLKISLDQNNQKVVDDILETL